MSDFPALSPSVERTAQSHLPSYANHLNQASTVAQIAASGLPSISSSQQREFSQDDFPALGGPSLQPDAIGSNLPNSAISRQQREQQAAQALAHRQGLLGSLALTDDAKRNYALKLNQNQQNWQSPSIASNASAANAKLANASPAPSANGLSMSTNAALASGTTQVATNSNGITLQQRIRSPSLPPSSSTSTTPAPTSSGGNNPPSSTLSQGLLPAGQQGTPSHAARAIASSLAPLPNGSSAASMPTGSIPQTAAQQIYLSPADRFGLLGLLNLIKMTDPDASMLALGSDLSKLGLDLSQKGNISSSFVTPWASSDTPDRQQTPIEPEFHLPACYNVHPPAASRKIGQFAEETLFYIFYSAPRDMIQEAAAAELYKHNWRYHKEMKLWLTKEQGVEPSQKTGTYERGSYIFFDPQTWSKVQQKEFVLVYDNLANPQPQLQTA